MAFGSLEAKVSVATGSGAGSESARRIIFARVAIKYARALRKQAPAPRSAIVIVLASSRSSRFARLRVLSAAGAFVSAAYITARSFAGATLGRVRGRDAGFIRAARGGQEST